MVTKGAVSLVRKRFGCLVRSFWMLTLRCIYGGVMPESTYRSGVAVERTACLIQSCVDELAMRGTGPCCTTILHNGET